jgi:sugar-phosphatase
VTTSANRAILFDADGVLVDSHARYRNVWEQWSRLRGLDPAVVLAATHARRPVDTIADVAPGLDAIAEYAVLVDLVNELPDAFSVFPDVAGLLERLPTDRWAIVTSGDADRVRAHLRAGGVTAPLVLVDGPAVTRGKPDPEGYLLAARLLGVRAEHCLVVEDAPAGIEAGLAAGMKVVAVTTSHPAQELTRADVVAPSFTAARSALLAWMSGGELAAMH